MMAPMYGKYPAIVKSYDKVTRTCRVEVPGITDGGDVLPLAEILYPVGDKWRTATGIHPTEIEMLAGDTVWVEFIGGDSRFPLIVGSRNPQINNSIDWRRWHHANIEITADGVMKLNAATIQLNAENIQITASADTVINADNTIINADTDINGGTLTHNSKSISDTHTHSGVQAGSGVTGAPT
jgi:hypothetical protein